MSDEPMTPTPDPAALDEAVSAYLDGEPVDPALRARPEFAARLAELTRARDALRASAPVAPLDEVTRRRMVRTALGEVPTPASAWSRRLVPLGAVAAVLAVVVGLGALALSGGDDSGDSAGSSDRQAETSEDDGASGGSDSAEPQSVPDLGDLGDVTDLEALAAELDDTVVSEEGDESVPEAAGSAPQCAPEIADVAPGPTVATGTGTYEGRPAIVVVTTDSDGEPVVLVATTDDCVVHSVP